MKADHLRDVSLSIQWKSMGSNVDLQNIFFCVPQKKESITGLEPHKGV